MKRLWRTLPTGWKGALLGAGLTLLLLMVQAGRTAYYGLGPLLDALVVVVLTCLGVALISWVFELLFGTATALAMLLLRRRPLWRADATRAGALTGLVVGLVVGCVGALIMGGLPTKPAMLGLAVIVPLLPMLLGGALGLAVSRGWRPGWALAVAVTLLLNVGLLAGLLYSPPLAVPVSAVPSDRVLPAPFPDPTLPGKYTVKTLTYGSGTDRRRPEYGEQVDLRTTPIDIARIWSGPRGVAAAYYKWFWGFTGEQMPLNGRVWYPEGEGPFPLVLMAHGNHTAGDYSDAGYAYLGELLASRGYVFASVDENFLNGSFAYNAQGEMPVRAYLLLRHVETLLGLGGPLAGKVDAGNIALMGHSRGGEAAAVASVFNQMALYPSNSSVAMNFRFNIKAVAALAPCDGQYKVRGLPTVPENVDYMVLQGGHDSDVYSFMGVNQYDRVTWSDGAYHFKTAVWVEHMNHGSMNTTWGTDRTAPVNWLYQEGPMLAAEEQQQVVKAYVSAFLDASLKGDRSSLAFLRDDRAGAAWLPATGYAPLFTDTTFQPIEQFELNADPKGASLEGALIEYGGLTVVEQQPVLRGNDRRQSKAALLTWAAGGVTPDYEIRLPASWQTDPAGALTFALGGATPGVSVDVTVELVDRGGSAAQVALSRCGAPLPQPTNPVTRFGLLDGLMLQTGQPGPVPKTFVIPLADFAAANSAFRPAELAQIRFRFDRTPAGSVLLDDVGLLGIR